jgi:predicted transcriptional regulator
MPTTPLDDVGFLARSPHRVAVLRALATGPRARPDLHDGTGIPQPTLGRVLGGFEARNWVERRDRAYALTALGELVVEAFEDLLDTVAAVQRVGDVLVQLPTDDLDVDLRAFADATVTTPEAGGVFAPVDRLTERFFEADHARILVHSAPPGTQSDHVNRGERFQESDRVVESINSAAALDQARASPETAALVRAGSESGRAVIYEYHDEIPFVLAVTDDATLLAPTDDQGVPTALLETDSEPVRVWAEATLDAYRDRARRVTPEDLPA